MKKVKPIVQNVEVKKTRQPSMTKKRALGEIRDSIGRKVVGLYHEIKAIEEQNGNSTEKKEELGAMLDLFEKFSELAKINKIVKITKPSQNGTAVPSSGPSAEFLRIKLLLEKAGEWEPSDSGYPTTEPGRRNVRPNVFIEKP